MYACSWCVLQAPKGRSNRVAKLLDHIMLKRPDEDFIKLKESLIELGQVHVAEYLGPTATDWAEELASADAARKDFSNDYIRGWKNLILSNRTKLVDELTINDELITELINFAVINVTFSEILKVIVLV